MCVSGRAAPDTVAADITHVRSWIAETYALVPAEAEAEAIDWETYLLRAHPAQRYR
ncbi:hypothetical protein [Streptomyces sp. NPDC093984]|uniref:hypothetical protein n=1 Tax=Streptomyces sp. NPDC093984 TaxID=3366052 RepID=UPI003821FDE1